MGKEVIPVKYDELSERFSERKSLIGQGLYEICRVQRYFLICATIASPDFLVPPS